MARLTERMIQGCEWAGRETQLRDDKLPGFFLSVNKTRKSFKVQADLWQGVPGRRKLVRSIRHTIGTTETHSLADARLMAADILSQIKRGRDPFAAKRVQGAPAPLIVGDPTGWTVDELLLGYQTVLDRKESSDRSIENVEEVRVRYLKTWSDRLALEIRKSDARDLHGLLSEWHGKVAANKAMRVFRAAYNNAGKLSDDNSAFEYNPIHGVIFHKERSSERVLAPDDLPFWWEAVQHIKNPIRREMHLLGLFSGLRPGTLMSIEKQWVDMKHCAIRFPKMKSKRAFHLPLSEQMIECLSRAIQVGDILYPGCIWLFPTRSKTGEIVHTKVVREKTMPSQTGHILRHTHRTMAQREKVSQINGRLLLDHKVLGIDGVYIHDRALFEPLLEDQQKISDAMVCHMK